MSAGTVVIGGGLAGSMAALVLAESGHAVTLLEKSTGAHDKVCGEFLSRESLHYLGRFGVHPEALGGVPVHTVRLAGKGFQQEARLPFAAWSLTRKRLDEAMLDRAAAAGVEVRRGSSVTGLKQQHGLWSIALRDGDTMEAGEALLATGKHELPGWPRNGGSQNGLVAFKMYYRLAAGQQRQLGGAVELALFPGGYAGLQLVEEGIANLCLLLDGRLLRHTGSPWAGVLQHVLGHSSHLQGRLAGAAALLEKPLAASRIPYGHLQRDTEGHLWRIGDQAAVIPSFCGDGMSIALHSGALAATCLVQGLPAGEFQRRLHHQLRTQMWVATRLSRLLVNWPAAARSVRLFPRLLPLIASMSRIPAGALLPDVHLPQLDCSEGLQVP